MAAPRQVQIRCLIGREDPKGVIALRRKVHIALSIRRSRAHKEQMLLPDKVLVYFRQFREPLGHYPPPPPPYLLLHTCLRNLAIPV